jgi:hypothetical protein
MSNDQTNDDLFVPVDVVVTPGQAQTLSFKEHPGLICVMLGAKRADPDSKGQIELFAVLSESDSATGERARRKSKWLEFAADEVDEKEIEFVVDADNGVEWTVDGAGGVVLHGEFMPDVDLEEEEEEDGDE